MTDFEQVRGEAVAEGVRRDTFLDICEQSGLSDRALQRVSAYVVAAENAGSGVHREAGRSEDKLPDPLASGQWEFSFKRLREKDQTVAIVQILFVNPRGA